MRVLTTSSSKGTDIKQVQFFLIGRGLYLGKVDGVYGPLTAAAVKSYQLVKKLLPADGIAGRLTWAAMIQDGLPLVADTDREIPHCPEDVHPLTNNEQRMRRWGRFEFEADPEPGNPENIRILGAWEGKNIVPVDCPIWGQHRVHLHREVVADYVAFMNELIDVKLANRLHSFDGGFNARFIRGSRTTLSNHAWGTAFDVNCDDNPLGHTPAYIGEPGSVRELVMIGVKHHFFSAGCFTRADGMHFGHL